MLIVSIGSDLSTQQVWFCPGGAGGADATAMMWRQLQQRAIVILAAAVSVESTPKSLKQLCQAVTYMRTPTDAVALGIIVAPARVFGASYTLVALGTTAPYCWLRQ